MSLINIKTKLSRVDALLSSNPLNTKEDGTATTVDPLLSNKGLGETFKVAHSAKEIDEDNNFNINDLVEYSDCYSDIIDTTINLGIGENTMKIYSNKLHGSNISYMASNNNAINPNLISIEHFENLNTDIVVNTGDNNIIPIGKLSNVFTQGENVNIRIDYTASVEGFKIQLESEGNVSRTGTGALISPKATLVKGNSLYTQNVTISSDHMRNNIWNNIKLRVYNESGRSGIISIRNVIITHAVPARTHTFNLLPFFAITRDSIVNFDYSIDGSYYSQYRVYNHRLELQSEGTNRFKNHMEFVNNLNLHPSNIIGPNVMTTKVNSDTNEKATLIVSKRFNGNKYIRLKDDKFTGAYSVLCTNVTDPKSILYGTKVENGLDDVGKDFAVFNSIHNPNSESLFDSSNIESLVKAVPNHYHIYAACKFKNVSDRDYGIIKLNINKTKSKYNTAEAEKISLDYRVIDFNILKNNPKIGVTLNEKFIEVFNLVNKTVINRISLISLLNSNTLISATCMTILPDDTIVIGFTNGNVIYTRLKWGTTTESCTITEVKRLSNTTSPILGISSSSVRNLIVFYTSSNAYIYNKDYSLIKNILTNGDKVQVVSSTEKKDIIYRYGRSLEKYEYDGSSQMNTEDNLTSLFFSLTDRSANINTVHNIDNFNVLVSSNAGNFILNGNSLNNFDSVGINLSLFNSNNIYIDNIFNALYLFENGITVKKFNFKKLQTNSIFNINKNIPNAYNVQTITGFKYQGLDTLATVYINSLDNCPYVNLHNDSGEITKKISSESIVQEGIKQAYYLGLYNESLIYVYTTRKRARQGDSYMSFTGDLKCDIFNKHGQINTYVLDDTFINYSSYHNSYNNNYSKNVKYLHMFNNVIYIHSYNSSDFQAGSGNHIMVSNNIASIYVINDTAGDMSLLDVRRGDVKRYTAPSPKYTDNYHIMPMYNKGIGFDENQYVIDNKFNYYNINIDIQGIPSSGEIIDFDGIKYNSLRITSSDIDDYNYNISSPYVDINKSDIKIKGMVLNKDNYNYNTVLSVLEGQDSNNIARLFGIKNYISTGKIQYVWKAIYANTMRNYFFNRLYYINITSEGIEFRSILVNTFITPMTIMDSYLDTWRSNCVNKHIAETASYQYRGDKYDKLLKIIPFNTPINISNYKVEFIDQNPGKIIIDDKYYVEIDLENMVIKNQSYVNTNNLSITKKQASGYSTYKYKTLCTNAVCVKDNLLLFDNNGDYYMNKISTKYDLDNERNKSTIIRTFLNNSRILNNSIIFGHGDYILLLNRTTPTDGKTIQLNKVVTDNNGNITRIEYLYGFDIKGIVDVKPIYGTNNIVVYGTDEPTVFKIINLETREITIEASIHHNKVNHFDVSKDGKKIYSSAEDSNVIYVNELDTLYFDAITVYSEIRDLKELDSNHILVSFNNSNIVKKINIHSKTETDFYSDESGVYNKYNIFVSNNSEYVILYGKNKLIYINDINGKSAYNYTNKLDLLENNGILGNADFIVQKIVEVDEKTILVNLRDGTTALIELPFR